MHVTTQPGNLRYWDRERMRGVRKTRCPQWNVFPLINQRMLQSTYSDDNEAVFWGSAVGG